MAPGFYGTGIVPPTDAWTVPETDTPGSRCRLLDCARVTALGELRCIGQTMSAESKTGARGVMDERELR